MKKITGMFVFLMLSSLASADAPDSWRPYMSSPNNQQVNGPCTIYAAVHCLEALYNYYYEFGNDKVELDVDDAASRFAGVDIYNIFQDIMDDGVHPIGGEESFPNFEHAYYGLKGKNRCSSLQEIKNRVDDYGPVCIKIKWDGGDIIKNQIGSYSGGDPVVLDLSAIGQIGNNDYHWVVVVDYDNNYLECLNSFSTGDDYFFKISITNINDWIYPSANHDNTGYAYIHTDFDDSRQYSQDPTHLYLSEWCAPKIYPRIIPYFQNYTNTDTIEQSLPMNFRNINEEMYIIADTETIASLEINDTYTRTINISREYSDGVNNDLIVTNTLTLSDCIIRPIGTGYFDGIVYVDNGVLNLTNVLINDLERGIQIIGGGSTVDADYITIANTNYGIYLDAGADMTLQNSNIGLEGNDITYNCLMQGGYGADFTLSNNNVMWNENYYAMLNGYEIVDVSTNFWNNDELYGYIDVFSLYAYVDLWGGRKHVAIGGIGYTPKIAAPSPYEMARYYESAGDWTNAKSSYLRAIVESNDSMHNKRSLKGLLRVYKNQEWRADDLRIIARNEYDKALNKHKPTFDFLYNETYVAEGDYFAAIEMFENCAKKYAGTSVEVRMLSRVANIYGDYLDDPATAKRYADRAATLNPGQPILFSAYWSAGVQYEPSKYTDKFAGVLEYYDILDEQGGELASGDVVTVSPNPFNPSTVISYTLNKPSRVELAIYSITGQKVAALVSGRKTAGRHTATFDGAGFASGMYFYRFESDAISKTGKLMLVK